jgi:hypothetical protein
MNQEPTTNHLSDSVTAKLLAGQRLTEIEKTHLAECEQCMKQALVALDGKRASEGPTPDSERSRPAAQRVLDRARKVFQREFGISLAKEPPRESAAKAS